MAVVRRTAGIEIHCPSCGRAMRPVNTAAHAGRHAELRTYECKFAACSIPRRPIPKAHSRAIDAPSLEEMALEEMALEEIALEGIAPKE